MACSDSHRVRRRTQQQQQQQQHQMISRMMLESMDTIMTDDICISSCSTDLLQLCDNTLAYVISFLDFHSALLLSNCTSRCVRDRLLSTVAKKAPSTYQHLWREIFQRHCFAPPSTSATLDYFSQCCQRRRLVTNLMGRRVKNKNCKNNKKKQRINCFNLPHSYFSFVPIMPRDQYEEDDSLDQNTMWFAPPVDFDCPSFCLTDPGIDDEMAFLDPFDGSLSVRSSCLEHCIETDQGMGLLRSKIRHTEMDDCTKMMVVDTNEDSSQMMSDTLQQQPQNRQKQDIVLMDMEDYFNISLGEYFNIDRSQNYGGRTTEFVLRPDDEVEIDLVGIEVKTWKDNNTMIALGRTLSTDGFQPLVVSELLVWSRSSRSGEAQQGNTTLSHHDYERFVCRVRGSYKTMELDPVFQRVYFVFPFQQGPYARLDVNDEPNNHEHNNNNNNNNDHNEERTHSVDVGSRTIVAYPLQPYPCSTTTTTTTYTTGENADYNDSDNGPCHFPSPDFVLHCQYPVSAIVVAQGGTTVLAATTKGTIEFWESVQRKSVVNIKAALAEARTRSKTTNKSTTNSTTPTDSTSATDANRPTSLTPVVTSFHFPLHQPLDRCGFVTLHHVHGEGSWLIVWKHNPNKDNSMMYEICSTITLPLSPRRQPRIHYDGRRLIVCGQDHIGMIILVYHVMLSWDDGCIARNQAEKTTTTTPSAVLSKGDEAAGVQNYSTSHDYPHHDIGGVTRFANRIRHAGLGGVGYHESVYMTCNERFLVVNTKTGNLLGASPTSDGLLVIDLQA